MLELEHISKVYRAADVRRPRSTTCRCASSLGEFLAIMGPSGCGKSTAPQHPGTHRLTERRHYFFLGEDVAKCSEEQLTMHRRAGVGFVFQSFNLIDDLTVPKTSRCADLPARFQRRAPQAHRPRARTRRPRASRETHAEAALGRAAATRGRGTRAGVGPEGDPRRRAHRQPRYGQRRCGDGDAHGRGEGRHHHHHGHALRNARESRRPRRAHARRRLVDGEQ